MEKETESAKKMRYLLHEEAEKEEKEFNLSKFIGTVEIGEEYSDKKGLMRFVNIVHIKRAIQKLKNSRRSNREINQIFGEELSK